VEFNECVKLGEFDNPDIVSWGYDEDEDCRSFNIVEQDFDALEVFTSGTTGNPLQIKKKIWQLENEVNAIELKFGKEISKNVVFNRSVSHQHFYGMPFGLIWPLCRGSQISRFAIKDPHQLNYSIPQILITSPSFLKSLTQGISQDRSSESNIQSIFSAGGVLDGITFSKIIEIFDTRLVDIYGSSESGHIAWRTSPNMYWQLQNGVKFKKPIESVLEIKSKFCPNYDWFLTSDLAIEQGESFEILGRADQIIKIEGTRVSLSQLIDSINASAFVEDCIISDLGNGKRSQLSGVLKLSKQGIEIVEVKGKLNLVNNIKELLKGKVNSISIPRRWRFVDDFPRNSLGKITKNEVSKLFSSELKAPIVVSRTINGSTIELLLDVPRSLLCFNGHFDKFPVVPGVALIEWAIMYAKSYFFQGCIFIGMSQVKFLKFIMPNQIVRLKLYYDSSTLSLKFHYQNLDNIFSTGILKFRRFEI
jgi:acyl-coenzyme A synthetase/AMP-(fatty) acid ligase